MGLETGTYISDLVATNPTSGDPKSQGDDHLRLLKSTIKATFPNVNGAVTATDEQLNYTTLVTAFIQTLLDDASASAARTTLGFTAPVIDRAYGEYTTNADLTTQIPLDDTIPQNTEGTQIISVAFTPKSATNRVRLRFQCAFAMSGTGIGVASVFSSASANALRSNFQTIATATSPEILVLEHEYVPGTTSALTYTVRVGPGSALTMRLNGNTVGRFLGGTMAATLVIEEIAV